VEPHRQRLGLFEKFIEKGYDLTKKQMAPIEKRIQRLKGLEKWFFSISPEVNLG
jgi:hypothetical protein